MARAQIQSSLDLGAIVQNQSFTAKMSSVYLIFVQVSTALVSFLSSIIMVCSIAWFGSEGSTPYRRIILGLSISEIFRSLAFITGPLSVPSSKISWEADDEATSCQANGFVGQVGATAVMLHTVFLCMYYLCRLKHRVSNNAFECKIERKFRAFIIIFSLTAGIVPLAMDAFHTSSRFSSICMIESVPTGCWIEPDIVGECDATSVKYYKILTAIFYQGLPVLCLMAIIVIMGLLYHHASIQNQIIKLQVSRHSETNHKNNDEISVEGRGMRDMPQDRVQQISILYRREMMIQATCCIGAFFLIHIPVVIGPKFHDSVFLEAIFLTFSPIGGLLNMLVYTRPKVASLRRNNPECSRLHGFWLVLNEGGEIPNEVDLSISCCQSCCRPPSEEEEYEHTSSVDPKRAVWISTFGGIHLSRIGI